MAVADDAPMIGFIIFTNTNILAGISRKKYCETHLNRAVLTGWFFY